ncbi:MAG TPA: hypothetical protein DEB31_06070, partial [Clostridiales bacterium]|nr:hypothetical protein [Clostridiales bacterium]
MKGKSTKSEYPHSGHRQRLKERFRREGLGGFEDHQALELLLFYAIPRRDTNELAHRLLAAFGSLKNVFAADVGDLQSIEGLGEHAAALLKLIPEIAGKYWFAEEQDRAKITSIGSAASYAKSLLYGRPMEHFYVI